MWVSIPRCYLCALAVTDIIVDISVMISIYVEHVATFLWELVCDIKCYDAGSSWAEVRSMSF